MIVTKNALTYTVLLLGTALACSAPETTHDTGIPKNFIYFGVDRSRITEAEFLETESIVGAQLKYTWPELEPERDRYDLQPILQDLALLEQRGKKLFIQLQDVSFEETIVNVPEYLLSDPAFGGGVARQYSFEDDAETVPIPEGWVARRWDTAVRARFIKLIQALAEELDGRVEGLNFPETDIGFGESGKLHPAGFTYERYFEAVKIIMIAAREAFQQSRVIVYANFMPGEKLPDEDRGYLRGVYRLADSIGVGVGGPDLLPHRSWQRIHSHGLIAGRDPNTVAGVAVQRGNLDDINPTTGERVTVEELYGYAQDPLRLDYIFWGTQQPHYSAEILPFLRGLVGDDGR